jgi:hypothetical protein
MLFRYLVASKGSTIGSVLSSGARFGEHFVQIGAFGRTVDFLADNRVIFDIGGNKYRLVVHISFTFGRVLVKFVGTHTGYDRIDAEIVSWHKK